MQVQFQNILFSTEDFHFAVVQDEVLTIVTTKGEIELELDSPEEADAALTELRDLVNNAKGTDISGIVQEAIGSVSSLFGGIFGATTSKFKAKSAAASTKAKTFSEEVQSRAEDILKTIEDAIQQVSPQVREAVKAAEEEAEDVFGTSRSTAKAARADVLDVAVSTLNDAQLRSAIEVKAEQLINNNDQVKELIDQIRRFNGERAVQEAIVAHKEMVFQAARDNDSLTVNEVFALFIR